MKNDLLHYTKFIGGVDRASARLAQNHFESIGLKTRLVGSSEAAELAKLTETTYFGVLIAWAQEVERYSEQCHVSYDDVVAFYEEIAFLPRVKYFPGIIGGHCVMPNIEILRAIVDSDILDAIVSSNAMKIREAQLESIPA
jgi:UDP-N-acetyl-D-mannosaminuronate dehydrogenase